MNPTERLQYGLHLDRDPVDGWQGLIEAMPDKEFQNVTRSTLPLLAYWMEQELDSKSAYHFEYTVASVGRARPSHTDLMIISPDAVVGIEGKSTEPRYPTVEKWLEDGRPSKRTVLQHWATLISTRTGVYPNPADLSLCVYQMVHRLASVCTPDRPKRTLVYQIFDTGTDHGFYSHDLAHLASTFDTGDHLVIELQTIPTGLTAAGLNVQGVIGHADRAERPVLVREALLDGGVFEFGTAKTELIRYR